MTEIPLFISTVALAIAYVSHVRVTERTNKLLRQTRYELGAARQKLYLITGKHE